MSLPPRLHWQMLSLSGKERLDTHPAWVRHSMIVMTPRPVLGCKTKKCLQPCGASLAVVHSALHTSSTMQHALPQSRTAAACRASLSLAALHPRAHTACPHSSSMPACESGGLPAAPAAAHCRTAADSTAQLCRERSRPRTARSGWPAQEALCVSKLQGRVHGAASVAGKQDAPCCPSGSRSGRHAWLQQHSLGDLHVPRGICAGMQPAGRSQAGAAAASRARPPAPAPSRCAAPCRAGAGARAAAARR